MWKGLRNCRKIILSEKVRTIVTNFCEKGYSSIGREIRSTQRNHQFVNYIEYNTPWAGFELTTLVVINTDCIGSCKSNYHTITTTTILYDFSVSISRLYSYTMEFYFNKVMYGNPIWSKSCYKTLHSPLHATSDRTTLEFMLNSWSASKTLLVECLFYSFINVKLSDCCIWIWPLIRFCQMLRGA